MHQILQAVALIHFCKAYRKTFVKMAASNNSRRDRSQLWKEACVVIDAAIRLKPCSPLITWKLRESRGSFWLFGKYRSSSSTHESSTYPVLTALIPILTCPFLTSLFVYSTTFLERAPTMTFASDANPWPSPFMSKVRFRFPKADHSRELGDLGWGKIENVYFIWLISGDALWLWNLTLIATEGSLMALIKRSSSALHRTKNTAN